MDRSSSAAAPRRIRRRRIALGYAGAAVFGLLVVLTLVRHARVSCHSERLPALTAVGATRWLSDAIAQVPCPGLGRVVYGARDNLGAPVDALDPIDDPAGGGYLGVYHSPLGTGRQASFAVSLARSSDLVHWTRVRVLIARGGSMPTLRPIPGSPGYLLAYERSNADSSGDTVALRYYPSRAALLAGQSAAAVVLPRTLSRFNDGTPAILGFAWRGGPRRSVIELGFHQQSATAAGRPGVDREAVGIVYGFRRFAAAPDTGTDAALDALGFAGSHGDRRQFSFGGATWRVYEAQSVPADFGSWHVLLTRAGGPPRFERLSIGLPGGPYTASFGNPIVSVLRGPGGHGQLLAVTMFVFDTGPAAAYAGELVYAHPF